MNAGRGRGGGHGSGRSQSSSGKKNTSKKIYKFSTQLSQGKKNFASYASMKEKITYEFQKEYGMDVARGFKKMAAVDFSVDEPKLKLSNNTNAAKLVTEQTGFNMQYQEEYRRHLDWKQKFKEDMMKAYTNIFTNYIQVLQICMEEYPDFENKIDDDLIKLLEVVKELMHEPVRVQYHLVSMTNNLQR